MPNGFQLEWIRMREYPLYEISNNGRFRFWWSKFEVPRDSLGTAQLLKPGGEHSDRVCGWAMTTSYFYGLPRLRDIAENSCLA